MLRTTQQKGTARLVIWLVVIVAAGLWYLSNHPIELSLVEKVGERPEVKLSDTGEVLIVVDREAIRRSADAEDFERVDWSLAWMNLAEQEFGPHTVLERRRLRQTDLTSYRVVVLTRSMAAGGADPDLVSHLMNYVSGGGLLVLEQPAGKLREACSADGQGGQHRALRVTHVAHVKDWAASQLASLPLHTDFQGSTNSPDDAVTYLTMDEVPVVYRTPRGRGHCVTVDFNLGLELVALQQGTPNRDFGIDSHGAGWVPSDALRASPSMVGSAVPYADLLEKFLVQVVLGDSVPIVSVWPFPDAKQGALLMTHNASDPDATWMAAWEHSQNLSSTTFVEIGDRDRAAAAVLALKATRSSPQLQWRPSWGPNGIFESIGLWEVRPLAQPQSLVVQAQDVDAKLRRGVRLLANRSANQAWSDTYTGAFRQLAEAKISVDCTYSPALGGRGYHFGTGLPFRALDTDGQALSVSEIPTLMHDDNGVNLEFLRRLFIESQTRYHEALNLDFSAAAYQTRPSLALFDLWQASYALAEDTDHAILSIPAYYRFWRSRLAVEIRVRLRIGQTPDAQPTAPPTSPRGSDEIVGSRNLAAEADLEQNDTRPPLLLEIEANTPSDAHSLAVPSEIRDREIVGAVSGKRGAADGFTRPVKIIATDVIGRRQALLKLKKGFNSITVTYR